MASKHLSGDNARPTPRPADTRRTRAPMPALNTNPPSNFLAYIRISPPFLLRSDASSSSPETSPTVPPPPSAPATPRSATTAAPRRCRGCSRPRRRTRGGPRSLDSSTACVRCRRICDWHSACAWLSSRRRTRQQTCGRLTLPISCLLLSGGHPCVLRKRRRFPRGPRATLFSAERCVPLRIAALGLGVAASTAAAAAQPRRQWLWP